MIPQAYVVMFFEFDIFIKFVACKTEMKVVLFDC